MPVRGSLTSMAMATTGCPVGQIKDANGECRWVYVPELESPSEKWDLEKLDGMTPEEYAVLFPSTGPTYDDGGYDPSGGGGYYPDYYPYDPYDPYGGYGPYGGYDPYDPYGGGGSYDPYGGGGSYGDYYPSDGGMSGSPAPWYTDRGLPIPSFEPHPLEYSDAPPYAGGNDGMDGSWDPYLEFDPYYPTEEDYTSLLGGAVKDGMWTREDGLLDIVGGGQVDPQ